MEIKVRRGTIKTINESVLFVRAYLNIKTGVIEATEWASSGDDYADYKANDLIAIGSWNNSINGKPEVTTAELIELANDALRYENVN